MLMDMDKQTLSSLLGWMSIACWVTVYSPQIIENYKLKSGEALSVAFVVVWLLGDICNAVGAVWAELLPTVIILGVYYTLCDVILLFQVHFYRWRNPAIRKPLGVSYAGSGASDENAPLLDHGPPVSFVQPPPSATKQILKLASLLVTVLLFGVGAWFVDEHFIQRNVPRGDRPEVIELKSQIVGWISATLYLGSRIPQIRKNVETKCEGLSPAMFLFAIAGNSTFTLSILAASLKQRYLIANASWLVGSAGTLALDVFVLGQFVFYRRQRARSESTLVA